MKICQQKAQQNSHLIRIFEFLLICIYKYIITRNCAMEFFSSIQVAIKVLSYWPIRSSIVKGWDGVNSSEVVGFGVPLY